jgi:hypothetical protein
MSPLTTKAQSLKFESKTSRSTAKKPKKLRKAEEDHLVEEKATRPTKDTKSDKPSQNDKEELRKSKKHKKLIKLKTSS